MALHWFREYVYSFFPHGFFGFLVLGSVTGDRLPILN